MIFLALAGAVMFAASVPFAQGPVELIADGFLFTEGPLWIPGTGWIFSDIPADTIFRDDKSVYRHPSGESNGLTLDREGRLIACEHRNRRVSRTESDGTITVLAERFEGKRLNSPNDVVVHSGGAVYFTDPPYGLRGGLEDDEAELDFSGVYRIAPDGSLQLLAKDFVRPNGLAFSPDEKVLYIADTQAGHIRAFDVAEDGTLNNGRVLCALPSPDGMKVDSTGNIWCTASDGVRIYSPAGKLLETMVFPAPPANCAFGEENSKTLFVTARTGVYRVSVSVAGIRPHGKSLPQE